MNENVKNLLEKAERNRAAGDWAESKEYYEVATSRYYYCLYQKAIYLSKASNNFPPISTKDTHKDFISKFTEYIERKIKDKSDKAWLVAFANLPSIRNKADYKTEIFTKKDYQLAFKKKLLGN